MAGQTAKALAALETTVLSADERGRSAAMLDDDCRKRLRAANGRDAEAWAKVASRADWERFRDARVKALRESLGSPPPVGKPRRSEVTGTLDGDGFRIEKLVYETRPGLVVTANLYVPQPPRPKMPGIVIIHSHHNPKEQGELQDMGVNWSRLGCLVLILDQIGHGERRQLPYGGRAEYRSRYYLGMQLHLVGETLCGWMVHDTLCGLDLLLARPGIDRERIVCIGAVAGGGDPAAVAVALDPRVTCSIPFNFGGPQPETPYPLPPGVEQTFNYAGGGSFESTRNLTLSARDGFLPWVIVGAAAPRPLIYAHEFAWDADRDPVWQRLEKVYALYGAGDRLAAAHGWGKVTLRPPEASHCNNVGPAHRKEIYPHLERWLGIPAPREEVQQRREAADLACMTDEVKADWRPKLVHQVAKALSLERAGAARAALAKLDPPGRLRKLRQDWARLLGNIEPKAIPKAEIRDRKELVGATAERILLTVEEGIVVPTLLLLPTSSTPLPPRERQGEGGGGNGAHTLPTPSLREGGACAPVVVAIAQKGKEGFLKHRADEVAALLAGGIAVCLPDLRAAGETDPNGNPGRHRKTVDLSSTDLMLGQTFLGSRLRDLRAVLRYLRTRRDLDAGVPTPLPSRERPGEGGGGNGAHTLPSPSLREGGGCLALWGDSFADVNVEPFEDPAPDANPDPREAEPMGGLLALFGALFEDDVRAVFVRRGLVAYEAVLCSPFAYVPHDVIVPGALTAGDLCDVAAALVPRPLRFEGLVGGRDCVVTEPELRRWLEPTLQAYGDHGNRLVLTPDVTTDAAGWLAGALK